MSGRYIRQHPYVDDEGIYIPDKEYVPEGTTVIYKCIMTKDMFVEAYNKWIKGDANVFDNKFVGKDDADDWCE